MCLFAVESVTQRKRTRKFSDGVNRLLATPVANDFKRVLSRDSDLGLVIGGQS